MGIEKYDTVDDAVASELRLLQARGRDWKDQVAVLHESSVAIPYID